MIYWRSIGRRKNGEQRGQQNQDLSFPIHVVPGQLGLGQPASVWEVEGAFTAMAAKRASIHSLAATTARTATVEAYVLNATVAVNDQALEFAATNLDVISVR